MAKEIHKCVKEQSKELVGNQFNIYGEYLRIERVLLEEGVLSEINQKGYKKALIMVFNSSKTEQKYIRVYKRILELVDYTDMLFFSGTLAIPFSCIGSYLEKNNLHLTPIFSNYYSVLEKAYLDFSTENPNLYYDLIKYTPQDRLDEIIFKAPIISVFLGAIHYNVHLDEMK